MKTFLKIALLLSSALLFTGCSTVNDAYYSGVEKLTGKEKRDLLVKRVSNARDAQQDAKEQFVSALDEFTSIVNFDGGELEKRYGRLKSELDRSNNRASAVSSRIASVERVSRSLFAEWKDEINSYDNANLKAQSQKLMGDTQGRYSQLIGKMKAAESKMNPVLRAFNDQVLYLKHNLNATAIASLKTELDSVEGDVASLIRDMEASIAEADAFIQGMQ